MTDIRMPLIPQPSPLAGGALLARLHAINAEYGYLPEAELHRAAGDLGVPLSQVYSTASFYASFSFEPRGRHTIRSARERLATSGAVTRSWRNLRPSWR